MGKIVTNWKILIVFLSFFTLQNLSAQVKEVTASTIKNTLAKEKDWVILDVRTPQEFAQGHIPGSLNINIHDNNAMDRIGKLNKNGKYLVYCRTRNRSGVVSEYMAKKGFKTVYQMVDGIGGWNQVKDK